MKKQPFLAAGFAGLVLTVLLAGCLTTGPEQSRYHRGYQTGPAQTVVVFEDDYDYYPGYEIYYSRNRHEYVYRDGDAWVRRPEPRGISASVLLSLPSVRVDFHDSPAQHHDSVVRSYPRNWQQPDRAPAGKSDHRDDKAKNKQNENRKDKDDHRKDDDK